MQISTKFFTHHLFFSYSSTLQAAGAQLKKKNHYSWPVFVTWYISLLTMGELLFASPAAKAAGGRMSFSCVYLQLWCFYRKSIREQSAAHRSLYITQIKKKQETLSTIYHGFLKAAMVGWRDLKHHKVITRNSTLITPKSYI